jgi:hypothetical protein
MNRDLSIKDGQTSRYLKTEDGSVHKLDSDNTNILGLLPGCDHIKILTGQRGGDYYWR